MNYSYTLSFACTSIFYCVSETEERELVRVHSKTYSSNPESVLMSINERFVYNQLEILHIPNGAHSYFFKCFYSYDTAEGQGWLDQCSLSCVHFRLKFYEIWSYSSHNPFYCTPWIMWGNCIWTNQYISSIFFSTNWLFCLQWRDCFECEVHSSQKKANVLMRNGFSSFKVNPDLTFLHWSALKESIWKWNLTL